MAAKTIEILECTLRDGSYTIDFQFTADDTAQIVEGLSEAGFTWIEIGHGLGLGAQSKHGKAAASDEQYVEAAVKAKKSHSKVGCFFIPGIGTKEQMKTCRELGMDFIRIGTNASEVEKGLDSISYARELGLDVSSNLMKSYVLSPFDICRAAKQAENAGANCVSLVDSAGGMLPEDVATYIRAMVDTVGIKVGFHGHNNLGLANACAMIAAENGARVIDSTLQGMGRSSGNSWTESMVFIFDKLGYETKLNPFKVMDLSEKLIRPRLGQAGFSPVDVTSGYALFHSSYLKTVQEVSGLFGVDERALIVEVSKINKDNPTRDMIVGIAAKLAGQANRDVTFPKMINVEKKSS